MGFSGYVINALKLIIIKKVSCCARTLVFPFLMEESLYITLQHISNFTHHHHLYSEVEEDELEELDELELDFEGERLRFFRELDRSFFFFSFFATFSLSSTFSLSFGTSFSFSTEGSFSTEPSLLMSLSTSLFSFSTSFFSSSLVSVFS